MALGQRLGGFRQRDDREASGYADAKEAMSDLLGKLRDLEDRIGRMPAKTMQGLIMKARMVAADAAFDGLDAQIEEALELRHSTGHFMGLSLVRDIINMDGGSA